jgi:hypothetical protein
VGWAELPGGAAAEATRPACLQSVNVSLARKKYGIQYPALYAGKEHIDPKGKCKDEKDVLAYNCVQRAHQNTVTMAGESVAPGCQSWPRRCAADARLRRAGRGVGGDHRHGPAAGRAQRPDLCDGYFVPACLPRLSPQCGCRPPPTMPPAADPKFSAGCLALYTVGRVVYGYGYSKGGPKGRMAGGLISHLGDLPLWWARDTQQPIFTCIRLVSHWKSCADCLSPMWRMRWN